jgi:hypothetical protein
MLFRKGLWQTADNDGQRVDKICLWLGIHSPKADLLPNIYTKMDSKNENPT